MFKQRKTITLLLSIVMMLQAPLAFAISCNDSSMRASMDTTTNISNKSMHDKCAEMSQNKAPDVKDQNSCEAGCCLVISAPALICNDVVTQSAAVQPLVTYLPDQLIYTYLESAIRPPIS